MQTVVVSLQLTLSLYESVKDMPASLYQTARQYEVMAAELGQNEAEQIQMLAKAENYALTGKLDEFREQMRNYRLARMLVKQKFQAGQLDWACYVKSVNGQDITDYSEDALLKQIDAWSALGLTQALIEETLDDVKKVSDELKRYFPARFNQTGRIGNQLEQLRKYLLAKANCLLDPNEQTEKALNDAFGLLVGQRKPACFQNNPQHVLTQMEKGFAKVLTTLSECGCSQPNQLSVFEFYNWLEHLEEKYEAQKEALKPKPNAKR